MGETLFKSLIESLQKNTCQVTHRIGYARVELSSTKSIDGVGQQSRDLACVTERMIRCVGWQHHGGSAAMDPASFASPPPIGHSSRIVKDT